MIAAVIAAAFAIFATAAGGGNSPGPSSTLFAAPYYTCSTNLYVSTTGNDTTGSGALGNPWLTISKANSAAPTAGTCINVQPGTYAAGATINHGGNLASSTGYVVYRCATLNGCIITDNGSSANNGVFQITTNYVMFDGFVLTASSAKQFGTGFTVLSGVSTYTFEAHHVWVLNTIISGYGQSGIQFNNGEYFYSIHNTTFNNAIASGCDAGAQGSGISYAVLMPISSYTPTSDDSNNPVTGNTGNKFNNFVMWNISYNNHVNGCSPATDGNSIILDTLNWNCLNFSTGQYTPANCTNGASPYTNGALVAFNVVSNDGGGGVHVFASEYVTAANNSCYNDFLDTTNTGGTRGCIDESASYAGTYINNIAKQGCGTGNLVNNSALLDGGTNGTLNTTLGAAITTIGQTAVTLSSASSFPGGASSWPINTNSPLSGNLLIQIDSEIMLVTGGIGTTSITVMRGYLGTATATHSNGATVTWVPGYWANNVSSIAGACSEVLTFNGANIVASQNKQGTDPSWVDVGNNSTGSMTTKPSGFNFAISGGSAAHGYGQTPSWLPAQAADAGACFHTLASCP